MSTKHQKRRELRQAKSEVKQRQRELRDACQESIRASQTAIKANEARIDVLRAQQAECRAGCEERQRAREELAKAVLSAQSVFASVPATAPERPALLANVRHTEQGMRELKTLHLKLDELAHEQIASTQEQIDQALAMIAHQQVSIAETQETEKRLLARHT